MTTAKHKLQRVFVDILVKMESSFFLETYSVVTQFKTRVQKPYSIYYTTHDQNGWKTLSFGATHTYMAHLREYPPPPPVSTEIQHAEAGSNCSVAIVSAVAISYM